MVAGRTGKYHIYRRTIKEKASGKPVRAWYYWFDDDSGARRRISCGTSKIPCILQREAEAFIVRLEEKEEADMRAEEDRLKASRSVRIRDIAEDMYKADGKHMRLRVERGEGLTDTTMSECRGYLKNYIVKYWGNRIPGSIDGAEVEDWLIDIDRSNAWRNRCLEVFNELFSECLRYKIINQVPVIKRLKRRKAKRDVLTTDEINALFPECPGRLEIIWRHPDPREPKCAGLMFAALFSLSISTGLRSGEVRAVWRDQIVKGKGLIVNKSFDAQERMVEHLKKGDEDDPRLRVVIIPERAMKILDWWIAAAPPIPTDYVFSYRGNPVRGEHATSRFVGALERAGIKDIEDRRLTPHALRYTYNTRMSRIIPPEPLRKMIGHFDEEMTVHYSRVELEADLESLQEHQGTIDQRFYN